MTDLIGVACKVNVEVDKGRTALSRVATFQ